MIDENAGQGWRLIDAGVRNDSFLKINYKK
jgi:hypothetical protein